ncbi:uncharacterized protein LOC121376342 isoform X2 [Gigantopelta aegis]|uniref:uncharacterized protein LOC121376342 isoform X2 n=1 Tax=Gigantopelta aegis TaxID=1735272 RepID=UPI001B889885|nr:uncharacterized protein LOC121376342 isoform X2 [Gigantopelta aegis]
MALTSTEKQRRYRQKRDQDVKKREEYLRKGRQRWMQYKASGKVKAISEKSPREQRQQRKAWRHSQRASHARKKDRQAQLTPPTSPVEGIPHPAMHSRQHIQGWKKVKKDRAACYRANQKLEILVQQQKQMLEMYKKRYSRLKNKITPLMLIVLEQRLESYYDTNK